MNILACDCEIYEICPSCAPSPEAYDKAVRDREEALERVPASIPKTYTLSDIEQLAHEFADSGERVAAAKLAVQATMLAWIEWMREREKKEGKG